MYAKKDVCHVRNGCFSDVTITIRTYIVLHLNINVYFAMLSVLEAAVNFAMLRCPSRF